MRKKSRSRMEESEESDTDGGGTEESGDKQA